MVRAIGAAEVGATTMTIAERVRDRGRTGVGAAEVELLHLAEPEIVEGDLVVPGIGGQCAAVPNDTWTVTDEGGRTSDPDVFAARRG